MKTLILSLIPMLFLVVTVSAQTEAEKDVSKVPSLKTIKTNQSDTKQVQLKKADANQQQQVKKIPAKKVETTQSEGDTDTDTSSEQEQTQPSPPKKAAVGEKVDVVYPKKVVKPNSTGTN